jgi:murein L,D-transpeptidase YcbB/YkuD
MKVRFLLCWASAGLILTANGAAAQTPPQSFSPDPDTSVSDAPTSSKVEPPAPIALKAPASSTIPAPVQAVLPAAGASAPPPAAVEAPATIGGAAPRINAPAGAEAAQLKTSSKPKKALASRTPRETALSDDPLPTLQSNTFFATAKASERYGAIADAGGWPTDIVTLRPGARGSAVAKLRKRLAIEGYLDSSGASGENWDASLTRAVKSFQVRMGLRQSGVVGGATLRAINVPARARFKQLASSAQRLAGINFPFGDRYVVVNLPSTSVESIENDRVVRRYVAIVGDPEHPSPEVAAQVQVINLNPTWTVPASIIKKEIIPRMQRDPGYLAREKIRILNGSGQEIDPKAVNWSTERAADFILRQDSGAGNSLGSIRIGMPNKFAVYMHDTPSKGLFGADYRFLSHGCVRVQGVFDYAAWLLQGTAGGPNGVWDKAALEVKVKEGGREDIPLAKPVPVIWVYLTGWSNGDGPANFREDVYGVDTVGEAQASVRPPRTLADELSASAQRFPGAAENTPATNSAISSGR